MGVLIRGPPWILCAAVHLLLLPDCAGTSSHSMHNFYTGVSESGEGLPRFVAVGYLDGQLIYYYDSNTRREEPAVPWMEKVEKDYPQFWDRQTQILHGWEQTFKANVEIVRNLYNQSKGFHTWQNMYGCELREDGQKSGYNQFGFDGRDFVTFDKETLTWTAADTAAQVTKRKWDADLAANQRRKRYLEEICIEYLQRYLDYGKEVLLRKEAPVVKVTKKADYDGMETLLCQAHGFYPKEIDVYWMKDGEVWQEGTFRGLVAPNSDGTYYAWVSVKTDPTERGSYWCHVEHDGLQEPLDLAWEEPASNMGLVLGCILGAVLLVLAGIAGILVYIKKRQGGYRAASGEPGEGRALSGAIPCMVLEDAEQA